METIRIGIVGLGENTRLRHVPGLRECEGVEIIGVCNRRAESTRAAAEELGIAKTYEHWEQLVADDEIDAVVIGTWPYLHCPITLAALAAGKHVLTEARMARNAEEARRMFDAAREHPELIAQIVPSPFGLRAGNVVRKLINDGYLGQLREVVVLGMTDTAADEHAPLHWRQSAELSGLNALALGILHETLIRWVPDPMRVTATSQTFTPHRVDPVSGEMVTVETPDSVHVLTELPGGTRGVYHLSGVARFGAGMQIHLYGSEGTLKYLLAPEDQLLGAQRGHERLEEIRVPDHRAGGWRVEADFIDAIRGKKKVELTDFATGLRTMEFTEAVARSAASRTPVKLPLSSNR